MNAKPDFKSYLLRQLSFKRYPWVIRAKDGCIYHEINGRIHGLIKLTISFIIFAVIFKHIFSVYFNDPYFWIIFAITFLLLFLLPIIVEITFGSLLYEISKFEIIDEERLKEYPGIKL